MVESVEDIIRQTAEKIDDKPTLEVVHPDHLWVGNDFPSGSHESRMKIKNYVNKEYHIDD